MFQTLGNLFNALLYQPLFNLLIFLQNIVPGKDFGISIVLLTLLVKLVLHPLSVKAVNSQRIMQKIQPKMKEIQEKYKNDKERQAKEIFEIYKTEKINPFSGLFVGIIQIPILIALYQVFWNAPAGINSWFLGLVDLSKPNIVFAVLAGATQYFQAKMLLPKATNGKGKENDFARIMQGQMTYFLPVFTVIILFKLPSALGLYWTASGIFTVIQQYLILKKQN